MTDQTLVIRRIATVVGVILVLALGVGSIRLAAAWTAASAPLTVAPDAVHDLETDLAHERDRSAALAARVQALAAQARSLEAALGAAQTRITGDGEDADAIRRQMAGAAEKLATLETAIARAERTLADRVAAAEGAGGATALTTSRSDDDDDEHDDDEHEDHHEHEDDDD